MHDLPDRDEIIRILKEVKDPETGLSVFDLGIVKSVDYFQESQTLVVGIDFKRRLPGCAGCVPVAWLIQKSITDELSRRFLTYHGVSAVRFTE